MKKRLLRNVSSLGKRSVLPALAMLLLLAVTGYAQTRVTGKITSGEDGSPIPGANILVKGTSDGTITDAQGQFGLNVPNTDAVLVVSFVGFLSQEVALAGRTSVDVTLATDAQQLSEVVVTALGVEKEVAKIGYSQQKVVGTELIKAREPNPLNSLVGKVAGLTVGASSEMLGAPQLVLRGETNLLITVDGVPVVSDTWNISPDDIESYTVLKGPAAAALYGSRGQNGAIMITTKKGTRDKRGFSVDFNSSTMVEKGFLTIPKVQNDYGPGEYNTYRFGDDDFGQKNGYNQNDYDVWGPKFNGQLISQYDSPMGADGVRTATPWVARGKDNLERFLRAGVLSTNNIAISSSTDKYDLRASVSHSYQRGIVPNTQLNMNNFNVSAAYNFSKKLRLESNINYNRQYTDNFPDVNYGPNSIIYNIDVWAGADWDINDLKNYWQPGKEGVQQRNFEYVRYNNPWFFANEWKRGHYKTDIYGFISLKYKLTDWMSAAVRTQVTSWDLLRNEKMPFSASAYGRDQKLGDYREDKRSLYENNTDVMLNIDKNITPDLNITALLGGNLRTYSYKSSFVTTDYLISPGVYSFSNSKNAVQAFNYDAPMWMRSGYYSLDLSYRHYVTLSTTGRYDAFSNAPKGKNHGFYPSVGLSSVVSDYVTLPEIFTFLKVRASYANVKNTFTSSTIGPAWQANNFANPLQYGNTYATAYDGPKYNQDYYGFSRPYNNGPAASYSNVAAASNLKPSSNSSFETGFDLRMVENRVGLNVTYFDAVIGPSIVVEGWSPSSGRTGGYVNGIKREKKGWEISANATPVKTEGGFTWNIVANWSKYTERYKEFYDGANAIGGGTIASAGLAGFSPDNRITYKVGDRVDGVYGYKFYRDANGEIIHKSNGAPYTDNLVAQKLGYSNPDWVWSIVNTVSYKNISLNFQFDGRVGGVGQDYVYKKLLQGGREASTAEGAYGAARLAEFNANPNDVKYTDSFKPTPTYIGPGVALTADSPAPVIDPATGQITNMNQLILVKNSTPYSLQDYIASETKFDERVLISKTFSKLRQVTLTYNFPKPMLEKTFLNAASISFVGRNLLYFAKRKDIDWDAFVGTNSTQQDLRSPTLRRYGVNINLTF